MILHGELQVFQRFLVSDLLTEEPSTSHKCECSYSADVLSFCLWGEKGGNSQETSHNQVLGVRKVIFLFQKFEDHMLVAMLLLVVPAKKSF